MAWKDFLRTDVRADEILGVPFVAEDPQQHRVSLTFEAYELLLGLKALIRDLDEQIKNPRLMRLTRDRLKAFRAGNEQHLQALEKLLRPLGHQTLPFTEFNQSLQRRRSGFALMQYYEHLFRDWDWGTAEVDASVAIALQLLGEHNGAQTALFLGAGACRFPYELYRRLGLRDSLCVDINAFLLSCAQRVIHGEPLELVEFPTLPVDMDAFSRRATLTCKEPVREGLGFLVHDLDEWAFRDQAADLVVTHWLIDAIPIPPARLFSLINRVLRPHGIWLNIGPVGFNKRTLAHYYSAEEVLALVDKARFELLSKNSSRTPYFQNPRSSHWRTEQVLGFAARKAGECSTVEEREKLELPGWLEDTHQPVDFPVELSELKRSYAFCSDLIRRLSEGKPSVEALAQALATEHGLTPQQAEHLVATLLMQWIDASRHNPMKSPT
jgi:hypothetical protein